MFGCTLELQVIFIAVGIFPVKRERFARDNEITDRKTFRESLVGDGHVCPFAFSGRRECANADSASERSVLLVKLEDEIRSAGVHGASCASELVAISGSSCRLRRLLSKTDESGRCGKDKGGQNEYRGESGLMPADVVL